MATYVLVPGAWHGSWCWAELVPLLEAAGHRVLTPDLAGMRRGADALVEQPLTIWADQIATLIASESDPVVLVGHSRAGAIISEAAERVPSRISLLVYLCAVLLSDGQSIDDIGGQAANAEALRATFRFLDGGMFAVDPQAVSTMFYADAPAPLQQVARERLVPEPIASFTTPIHVTADRYGSVPRAYIECLDDLVLPIATQRVMQDAVTARMSIQLRSGHSPFFSQPRELAAALEQARTTAATND